MQSAAKVGGLVVIFVAMAIGVLAVLNQSFFVRRSTPYKVSFQDAGGLTAGSRVMMSGVLVGRVDEVKLQSPTQAVASISLDDPHELTQGSIAVLPSSLISIGDREIQITPGRGPVLPAESTIVGTLRSPIESMVPDSEAVLAEVKNTLVSLNKLLQDKDLKNTVVGLAESGQKTMEQARITAASADKLINRFDSLARDNGSKIGRILATSEQSIKSVAAMTKQLEGILAKGEFQNETMALLKKLNQTADQGQLLVQELQKTVADPELQASLKTTTKNVEAMTNSGTKVAKDFESISANGIEASKKVNELLGKANSMADDVKKLLEQFKGTIDKIGGAQKSTLSGLTMEADLLSAPDEGRIRTDINATIPIGKERAILGIYDAFEANKINLQLQRPLAEGLDLRYGVYASKLGVGVNYRLAPSLQARGDLYGLNDPRFDLRLRYDFSKNIYGWLGMDRMFSGNTPIIGVGLRR